MSFSDDLARFTVKVENVPRAVLVGAVADAKTSIVEGSPITGAPGQPVDEGTLRESWQVEFLEPDIAQISTNLEYAILNEEGVRADGRPYVQRSPIGGRHSVKLTIAGFPKIVEAVTARLAK